MHLFFRWFLSNADVKLVPIQCNSEGGTYTFDSEVGFLQVHFLRWSLQVHFYLRLSLRVVPTSAKVVPTSTLLKVVHTIALLLKMVLQELTLRWSLQVHLFLRCFFIRC